MLNAQQSRNLHIGKKPPFNPRPSCLHLHQVVICANTPEEHQELLSAGLDAIYCNQNAWLNFNTIFTMNPPPPPSAPQNFTAAAAPAPQPAEPAAAASDGSSSSCTAGRHSSSPVPSTCPKAAAACVPNNTTGSAVNLPGAKGSSSSSSHRLGAVVDPSLQSAACINSGDQLQLQQSGTHSSHWAVATALQDDTQQQHNFNHMGTQASQQNTQQQQQQQQEYKSWQLVVNANSSAYKRNHLASLVPNRRHITHEIQLDNTGGGSSSSSIHGSCAAVDSSSCCIDDRPNGNNRCALLR
jgi:hypothetical protein